MLVDFEVLSLIGYRYLWYWVTPTFQFTFNRVHILAVLGHSHICSETDHNQTTFLLFEIADHYFGAFKRSFLLHPHQNVVKSPQCTHYIK